MLEVKVILEYLPDDTCMRSIRYCLGNELPALSLQQRTLCKLVYFFLLWPTTVFIGFHDPRCIFLQWNEKYLIVMSTWATLRSTCEKQIRLHVKKCNFEAVLVLYVRQLDNFDGEIISSCSIITLKSRFEKSCFHRVDCELVFNLYKKKQLKNVFG